MTAEKYFSRLIYLNQKINANIEELERIKAMMDSVSSPKTDGFITSKGGPSSRVESLVVKFTDLEADIDEEIFDLIDMERDARKVLLQIENQTQRIVLQEFYLNRRTIEAIASSLYLTYRRVQTIKKEGLASAQKIIDRTKDSV